MTDTDSTRLYADSQKKIYGRDGVEKDVREGAALLKQAAEAGHPRAQFEWGMALREGEYFVPVDEELGASFIAKAYEAKDPLAGFFGLAAGVVPPSEGMTEDDVAKLLKLVREDESDPWAMYLIGSAYDNGWCVKSDIKQAAEWYQRAADAGNIFGVAYLGFSYAQGYGVEKDEARALELYKAAAELGDASSTHNVGYAYENANGVEKDVSAAAEWYRKAHALGYAQSAQGLERMGLTV